MVTSPHYICNLLELDLPVPFIAELFGVSTNSMYHRMAEFRKFYNITIGKSNWIYIYIHMFSYVTLTLLICSSFRPLISYSLPRFLLQLDPYYSGLQFLYRPTYFKMLHVMKMSLSLKIHFVTKNLFDSSITHLTVLITNHYTILCVLYMVFESAVCLS